MDQETLTIAHAQWLATRDGFDALEGGTLGVSAFCAQARLHAQLRGCLPPRYGDVLDQLLDRLESSALFSEDSCSFSQSDLRANLRLWLDKAHSQLTQARAPDDTREIHPDAA